MSESDWTKHSALAPGLFLLSTTLKCPFSWPGMISFTLQHEQHRRLQWRAPPGQRRRRRNTHTAEIRSIELNREEPARTSHQPVLPVFVPTFFCLSLLGLGPLLLRKVHGSNNAQGSLYNHSWQPSRCPASLHSSSTSQPVSPPWSKMIPTHYTS